VLVSIPEGEGKIAKYPVMFRQADLVLFTKNRPMHIFNMIYNKKKGISKDI